MTDPKTLYYIIAGTIAAALIVYGVVMPEVKIEDEWKYDPLFKKDRLTGVMRIKKYYFGGLLLVLIDLHPKGKMKRWYVQKLKAKKYKLLRRKKITYVIQTPPDKPESN